MFVVFWRFRNDGDLVFDGFEGTEAAGNVRVHVHYCSRVVELSTITRS